jgi:hypothetical protein
VKYLQLPLAPAVPASETPAISNSYAFGNSDNDDIGYGEVDLMRTPTGAQYQYRYALEQSTGALGTDEIVHHNPVIQRTISYQDSINQQPVTLTWGYAHAPTTTTVTNPGGGVVIHTFNDPDQPHRLAKRRITIELDDIR